MFKNAPAPCRCLQLAAVICATLSPAHAAAGSHKLAMQPDLLVDGTAHDGSRAVFAPVSAMLRLDKNPQLVTSWGRDKDPGLKSGNTSSTYHELIWGLPVETVKDTGHVSDGYTPTRSDRFYGADRFPYLFRAGRLALARASAAREEGGHIHRTFRIKVTSGGASQSPA